MADAKWPGVIVEDVSESLDEEVVDVWMGGGSDRGDHVDEAMFGYVQQVGYGRKQICRWQMAMI